MKDEKTIIAEETAEETAGAKSQTSAKKNAAKLSPVEAERAAFARTVKKKLPRRKELGKKQQVFYSVNGRNFLVKLGEEVDLPEPIANLVEQNKRAEEDADDYAASLPTASAPNQK